MRLWIHSVPREYASDDAYNIQSALNSRRLSIPQWTSNGKRTQTRASSCWDGRSFGHNRHGPKSWGLLWPFPWGAGSPSNTCNVLWAEAYLRTKWHPNLSYRLVTIYQHHRQTDSSGQRSDSRANRFTNGSPQKLKTPNRLAQEIWTNCVRLSIRLWLTMSEYSKSFRDIVAWRRWKLVTRLYRPSVENLCQHCSVTD